MKYFTSLIGGFTVHRKLLIQQGKKSRNSCGNYVNAQLYDMQVEFLSYFLKLWGHYYLLEVSLGLYYERLRNWHQSLTVYHLYLLDYIISTPQLGFILQHPQLIASAALIKHFHSCYGRIFRTSVTLSKQLSHLLCIPTVHISPWHLGEAPQFSFLFVF